MPALPVSQAPSGLLSLFNTEKESILARYYEPEPGLFIAESAKVAIRASQAGYKMEAMLIDESGLTGETRELLMNFPDVPAFLAPPDRYLSISGYPMTRGALALFRRKNSSRPRGLDGKDLFYPAGPISPEKCRRAAVLDSVGNPANIGAIFRSAAALNVDAILLTNGCCDPLSRRCLRVSMGCVFSVPFVMTGMSGDRIAGILKEHGFVTAAMALSEDSVSVSHPPLKALDNLALFLGNEGNGLPEETIRSCDYTVRIPMKDGIDSLNVAAASAVAFWELCRLS